MAYALNHKYKDLEIIHTFRGALEFTLKSNSADAKRLNYEWESLESIVPPSEENTPTTLIVLLAVLVPILVLIFAVGLPIYCRYKKKNKKDKTDEINV